MNDFLRHPITIITGSLVAIAMIIAAFLIHQGATTSPVDAEPIAPLLSPSASAPATVTPVKTTAPKTAPTGHTVTYIAKGDAASITFGTDGQETGMVPMNKTETIKTNHPIFSIIAHLNDTSSKTTLVIKIDGKTIGKVSATTTDPIASLTVSKAYDTGKWTAVPSLGG